MPWTVRTLLTISLILLPIYVYIGLRSTTALNLVFPGILTKARIAALLVIVWLSVWPLFLAAVYFLGTSSPFLSSETRVAWTDYFFYYPVWMGMIVALELLVPFLLADVVAALLRLIPSITHQGVLILAWCRIVMLPLVLMYVVVRVILDTGWVRDDQTTLTINRLPPELAGFTITLVADIQVDRYTGNSKVEQIRRILARHHPEMLVSGGDLVTAGTAYLDSARSTVCGMSGSFATIAVMGDHDIWSAPQAIRRIYEECGWSFLDNEHRLLSYHGKSILVTGLTHVYSERLSAPALEQFFKSAPNADLKILLVHQPAEIVVRTAARYHYDLILAGHTHGGQIVFHPLGIPFAASMRETRYYSGVYKEGNTSIVVTRGVGLTLAPVRYSAPAEVTTIVLQ